MLRMIGRCLGIYKETEFDDEGEQVESEDENASSSVELTEEENDENKPLYADPHVPEGTMDPKEDQFI
jgi:hypothetical protein